MAVQRLGVGGQAPELTLQPKPARTPSVQPKRKREQAMSGTKMSGGTRTLPHPKGGTISGTTKAPTRPVVKQSGASSATRMSAGGTHKGNNSPASGPGRGKGR